jgi:hypothetical protein
MGTTTADKIAKLVSEYPALADVAAQRYIAREFDHDANQVVEQAMRSSSDAFERSNATNLRLTNVAVKQFGADGIAAEMVYSATREGRTTTARLPLKLFGPKLDEAEAAMERTIESSRLSDRARHAKPLWQAPELEAKLLAAIPGGCRPQDIVAVTTSDGSAFIGRKALNDFMMFDGHPGNDQPPMMVETPAKTGNVYVTVNTQGGLAGSETLYVFAEKDGALKLLESQTLSKS